MATIDTIKTHLPHVPYSFRPRRGRLLSRICELEEALRRHDDREQEAAGAGNWLAIARELLAKAQQAAQHGRLDEGWKCVTAAERMEIMGVDDDELASRVDALRAEARAKLSGWRRAAVLAALKGELREQHIKEITSKALSDKTTRDKLIEDKLRDAEARLNEEVTSGMKTEDQKFTELDQQRTNALAEKDEKDEELVRRIVQDLSAADEPGKVSRPVLHYATFLRDDAYSTLHFTHNYYRYQLVSLLAVMVVALGIFVPLSEPQWFDPAVYVNTPTQRSMRQLEPIPDVPDLEAISKEGAPADNPTRGQVSGSGLTPNPLPAASAATQAGTTERWSVNRRFLLGLILLGVMGGAFSAILTPRAGRSQRRAPEQIVDSYVTVFRPALGGVGALVVFALLASGVINLSASAPGALAVAFVAGFSERLVLRGVETLGGAEQR